MHDWAGLLTQGKGAIAFSRLAKPGRKVQRTSRAPETLVGLEVTPLPLIHVDAFLRLARAFAASCRRWPRAEEGAELSGGVGFDGRQGKSTA